MEKLMEIMKPIDERKEFKRYWDRRKQHDWLMTADHKDPGLIIERRIQNRKDKMEKMVRQLRKPDRDVLMMTEDTREYDIKVNDQVTQLKQILAKDNIGMSDKILERAFKFPSFKWEESAFLGQVQYPDPSQGLMINPFPKEKKKTKGRRVRSLKKKRKVSK